MASTETDSAEFRPPDSEPGSLEHPYDWNDYKSSRYDIVSTVAYLIGVRKEIFENEHESPQMVRYEELEQQKNARIVRNLCRIRTALFRNFVKIQNAFHYDMKNIGSLPDYIPTEAVEQLSQDGIQLHKSRPDVTRYLVEINRELSNRIATCQQYFPVWIKWPYIKELFILPNGMKPEKIKDLSKAYARDQRGLPYQCAINFPDVNCGNLLYNDAKFVRQLYELHEDRFEDYSLVLGPGRVAMNDIYSFIQDSYRVVMVVDCENSDPVKLAGTLSSLTPQQRTKIEKILLFDSDYTTSEWKILYKAGNFPMEHISVPRLIEKKSQVDMTLTARTCQEVYKNNVDGVVLVSSDSDYWALIQSLSDVKFLVMMERSKSGRAITATLEDNKTPYCYLDDFCTGASYSIKAQAILESLEAQLGQYTFNVNDLLNHALSESWIRMTDGERRTFYDRYIKGMRLKLDAEGNVTLVLDNVG